MRGRPRKVYLDSETPVATTIRISKGIRDMLPEDANLSRLVEAAILSHYGDRRKAAIEEQRKKVQDLEIELARAKLALAEMEAALENEEKIRKALRVEEKYAVRAFRHFISTLVVARSGRRKVGIYQEIVEKRWGITFDREKLDSEFEEFLAEFEEGISDDELVRRYSIRKAGVCGELEREIKAQIEAELGVD